MASREDFHAVKKIAATRSPHKCEWCLTTVLPNNIAWQQSGKLEGFMVRFYFHEDCFEALARDPCSADGEACQDDHDRGMSCHETETSRFAPKEPLCRLTP